MLTTIRMYVALVAIIIRVSIYRLFGWQVVATQACHHVVNTWFHLPWLMRDDLVPMTTSVDQLRVTIWMLVAHYAQAQMEEGHKGGNDGR